MLDFTNQVVLVTGAGSAKGMGRVIAQTFGKQGAKVVICDINQAGCDANVEEMKKMGIDATGYAANLTDPEAVKELVNTIVDKYGRIDVLVNNAGITRDTLMMRMSEEDFDAVINTNLKGCFNMMKHASKIMMKQKSGAIINMSSVIGVAGNIGQVNYAASKAGVIGMTYSVAKELAPRNITCNAIAPGMIATDMTDVLADKMKESILSNIPLKRFGQPEEIAETAVFLAKSKYITGQVIRVDGGMVIG